MKNVTYIYLVENCYSDPNKVYIGKTKNSREKDHKKTYGCDIKYTIIDKINSLDRKYWKFLESYWIEQFKQWGFNVLNKQKGGSGVTHHSEETKHKMSLSRKGRKITWGDKIGQANINKKHSEETKQKMRKPKSISKKGIEHKLTGTKRSNETKIKQSLSLKGKTKSKEYKEKISNIKSKPIFQFDKSENFIQEWKSATEAALSMNKRASAISECCSGKRKSIYGYIWRFKEI
jgi:hypothetical protein